MPQSNRVHESAFAEVSGTRLHYRLAGDPSGPPVLLWHGFLETSHCWEAVMSGLAGLGFSVIAPDMRGYGDSDKPPGTSGYDARALADEFRSLVKQLGFGGDKPLILVGHDMGAPPALIWAADHPEEVAGLLYVEGPVMLSSFLSKIIAYTPEAMKEGSMWWWILPLAPGVPERLIVGHERAFLEWFYDKATAHRSAITSGDVDEALRTFTGVEGVLGAVGVYRAQFTSIEQTEPLAKFLVGHKVKVPVVALGGDKSLGENLIAAVKLVAKHVEGVVVADCGHFIPQERPDVIIGHVRAMWDQISKERSDINFVTTQNSFSKLKRSPQMNTHSLSNKPIEPVPPDDAKRFSTLARPDIDESLPHIGLVGDTYTVLLSGEDTDGRYCLIDMHIPPGGGPPPHRHDFEETFIVKNGEIEATFRGEKSTVKAGETLHIPANAPHSFTNATAAPTRLLCLCAPAGQEDFFAQVGVSVASRTTPPPKLHKAAQAASMEKAKELAPKYRTELLGP